MLTSWRCRRWRSARRDRPLACCADQTQAEYGSAFQQFEAFVLWPRLLPTASVRPVAAGNMTLCGIYSARGNGYSIGPSRSARSQVDRRASKRCLLTTSSNWIENGRACRSSRALSCTARLVRLPSAGRTNQRALGMVRHGVGASLYVRGRRGNCDGWRWASQSLLLEQ